MKKNIFISTLLCLTSIVACQHDVLPDKPDDKTPQEQAEKPQTGDDKEYDVSIDLPSDETIVFEAFAESFNFNVTAEGPWTIEVEEVDATKASVIPDYLTIYPTSGGSGVVGVEVNLSPNYSVITRAIHLLIRHQKKTTTISIVQQPRAYLVDGILTIAVMKAGSLGESLDEIVSSRDNVSSLRVLGNLDASDATTLRQLKNLAYLDMRECSIPSIDFSYHRAIEIVYLPDTMTKLPDKSFSSCSALRYIYGENVLDLGALALAQDSSLEECYFPNVVNIDYEAFSNCKSLSQVKFPAVQDIGGGAFKSCSGLTVVSFDSMTEMKNAVLSGWSGPANLEAVNLPALRKLCNNAFEYQTKLKTLELPNLVELGSSVLANSSVEEINLPAITYIAPKTFSNSNLRRVYCENVETVGESAFAGCELLKDVIMPKATSLDPKAFYQCTLGGELDFSSVMFIGDNCFQGSKGLGSDVVQFPLVLSIGDYAFENCSGLVSIVMPLVTHIGSYAFSGCELLAIVGQENTIPLLSSLGSFAFLGCRCLLKLSLPCLTNLGTSCFNKTGLVYLRFGALLWDLTDEYGMPMSPFDFWAFPIDNTADNIDLVIPNGDPVFDENHPWWRKSSDGSETFLARSWHSVNGHTLIRRDQ